MTCFRGVARRAVPVVRRPRLLPGFFLAFVLLAGGVAPVAADELRILAFGNSLTAGFGLPPEQSFPQQLERRLRADGIKAQVVSAGVSGDTTAGGLARLDWVLAEKPDVVILELGANDMLRGTDPATVRANLDAMIEKIKASGAKVLLAGMRASPNWGEEYQRKFDRIYPELARKHDVALYPFFLEGVATVPELNQLDGIHPNARGVAVIVDGIAPVVADLIKEKKRES